VTDKRTRERTLKRLREICLALPETDMRCHGMTSWDFRKLVEGNGEIAWEILASTARKLYENAERERARAG